MRWQYFNVGTKQSPGKRLQRLWHGSRDSARTPLQWIDEENACFTTGTPWFYVNENEKEVNVAAQERDPDPVLNFYRKAIALRKELSCVRHGSYTEYGKLFSKGTVSMSGRGYVCLQEKGQTVANRLL